MGYSLSLLRSYLSGLSKVDLHPVPRDSANLIVLRCFRGNTASTKAASSKHQASSSKLQRSTKLQRSSKAQAPNPGASDGGAIRRRVEVWGLELLWSLELGIWNFSESLWRQASAQSQQRLLCPLRAHHIGIRNYRIGEIAFKFLKNPAQAFLQA